MRKFIATAAAALMLASGLGVASANGNGHGPPWGPDGINENHPAWYGLCTAYYNNDDEAKQAPPFKALEDHFTDDEGDLDAFCESRRPGNSGDRSSAPAPGPRGDG